jgi:hypothetical protein
MLKSAASSPTGFLKAAALSVVLVCSTVAVAVADVLNIKQDAPTTYVVEKGDTLWDISNLFLSQPWLWPELWRNNTQIENPHLIYPGDTLLLRYEDGQPVIEIVRDIDDSEARRKNSILLTPESRVVSKPNPISTLPWAMLSAFVANDALMDASEYDLLPTLLGDNFGTPRFSEKDYVLAQHLPDLDGAYQVVRKVREVIDSSGNNLGLQVTYLSDAQVSASLANERQIVHLTNSSIEAKQGDRLKPLTRPDETDLKLAPADTQVGEIVQHINGNSLIAMKDVVIVNIGKDQVAPGTVFGIYQQGEDIVTTKSPRNSNKDSLLDIFSFSENITQPAYKVGELVIVKSFENASYAWITKAETHLVGGEIIAKP